MEQCRFSGNFASDTMFNLSRKVLTDTEIKVMVIDFDFVPTQKKLNELKLWTDFKEYYRHVRLKLYFSNESTSYFSRQPSFLSKSFWSVIVCHPNREVFLRQNENELLQISSNVLSYSKLTMEEWKTNLPIADDKSIVTKKADNRSCVEVWDRNKIHQKLKNNLTMKIFTKMCHLTRRYPAIISEIILTHVY